MDRGAREKAAVPAHEHHRRQTGAHSASGGGAGRRIAAGTRGACEFREAARSSEDAEPDRRGRGTAERCRGDSRGRKKRGKRGAWGTSGFLGAWGGGAGQLLRSGG